MRDVLITDPPPNRDFAVYDTWTTHYERDGLNSDLNLDNLDQPLDFPANQTHQAYGIDQGADGIDNDGVNGADDTLERETSPPYPYPIRGIQVTIRVLEPDTQQIRQTRVVSNFVTE